MNACALVVASADGPGTLLDTAQALDFDTILPFRGVAAAERRAARTPLVFFLFEAVADPRTHAPIAAALRASSKSAIRFAPLICFTRDPSREIIRTCINIGFDDVVTLPFTRLQLRRRLERQLETPCVYFETATYFGPDRRNRLRDSTDHSGRGTGGEFRRFEVVRSVQNGVQVVGEDHQVVVI